MNIHRTTALLAVSSVVLLSISVSLSTGCSLRESTKESEDFFRKILDKDTYSLYRPDLQQGNAINPQRFRRLKPGMTTEQIHYLLGNPITHNPFHKNRWDYYYYFISGTGEKKYARLTLFFEDGRLARYRASKELSALRKKSGRKKSGPQAAK